MTKLDDFLKSVGDYLETTDHATSDAAYAEGRKSREAEVKAAQDALAVCQAEGAADAEQLATLQASYDALKAQWDAEHPTPPPTPPPIELTDFAKGVAPRWRGMVTSTSYDGGGATIRMLPNTSTRKDAIPLATDPNPLRMLGVGGNGAGSIVKGLEFQRVILEGTEQGHDYGGVQFLYIDALYGHHFEVRGIPGSTPGPPNETPSVELLNTSNAHLADVLLDGRNAAGKAAAASPIMMNFVSGETVLDRVQALYGAAGFAAAMWRCKGLQVFNDCDFRFGRKAVNIEQSDGGSYELNRCDFRGLTTMATGQKWHAQVSSRNGGMPLVIRAPITDDGRFVLRSYPSAIFDKGKPTEVANQQQDALIRCEDANGKDITKDPAKFLIVHTG